jgi:hypothetical protein
MYISMIGKVDSKNVSQKKSNNNFIAEKKHFSSEHEEHLLGQQRYKRKDIFTNIKCVNALI